jgi:hypothetical protein
LVGSVSLRDAANAATSTNGIVAPGAWPVKEIKQFERMKVIKRDARHMGDIGLVLRPYVDFSELDELDTLEEPVNASATLYTSTTGSLSNGATSGAPAAAEKVIALETELALVKAQLQRAKEINQEMWTGVVDRTFEQVTGKRAKDLEKTFDGDVQMAE